MSGFKDLAKNGWHPKPKDGKSDTWRGDFKGINQVAGWMGKGKDTSKTSAAEEHYSVPITSLKDPAAFGPPPKNVNYHGGAALPNQLTPDTRGIGAPLSWQAIEEMKRAKEEEERRTAEEQAREAAKPPLPFRADRSGLSTSHLPPPPARKDGADGRAPPSASTDRPSLPPRLPPRQNSSSSQADTRASAPDSHPNLLNERAVDRLGKAGISVAGFGIGAKKSVMPSPNATSSAASPSRQPSSPGTAQLGELQTRFAKFGRSTSSSASSPAEGTTLEQKQSALSTARAFHKDPSSVSFKDARAAVSTADNFRERHGDQVKAGWQSANSMNEKYGLVAKAEALRDHGAPVPPAGAVSEVATQDVGTAGKISAKGKPKPPPPPPKKRIELAGISAPAQPPPLNMSSKPRPPLTSPNAETPPPQPARPRQSNQSPSFPPPDLDLSLATLWFAKVPPAFPPPTITGKRSFASSSGWSSDGVRKRHTFVAATRDNSTLVTTKIRLTWDSSNPGATVKAEQKHTPPPRLLSPAQLEDCRERYSEEVAAWCESRMGQQVGNGECWTLAHDALQAIGAQHAQRGQEACMSSQSLVHGHILFTYCPGVSAASSPAGGVLAAGVARGDVIQLLSAHFRARDGRSESWAGAPDHTAVVTGIDAEARGGGGALRVVEQNVGGVKRVQPGRYDFGEMHAGEVRIYRAVGEAWLGKLEPVW